MFRKYNVSLFVVRSAAGLCDIRKNTIRLPFLAFGASYRSMAPVRGVLFQKLAIIRQILPAVCGKNAILKVRLVAERKKWNYAK